MKNGAIISNSGHFNVEIDIAAAGENVVFQAHHPQLRRRVLAAATAARSTCSAKAA